MLHARTRKMELANMRKAIISKAVKVEDDEDDEYSEDGNEEEETKTKFEKITSSLGYAKPVKITKKDSLLQERMHRLEALMTVMQSKAKNKSRRIVHKTVIVPQQQQVPVETVQKQTMKASIVKLFQ